MTHAELAELTSRNPDKMLEEMLITIGDGGSDLASSDNGHDGEDEFDEMTEQGKLSEDDKPGWMLARLPTLVQQQMETCRQKQMKCAELTKPGWQDLADYIHEQDKKNGKYKWSVPTVV
jgi:hypothetical protein